MKYFIGIKSSAVGTHDVRYLQGQIANLEFFKTNEPVTTLWVDSILGFRKLKFVEGDVVQIAINMKRDYKNGRYIHLFPYENIELIAEISGSLKKAEGVQALDPLMFGD